MTDIPSNVKEENFKLVPGKEAIQRLYQNLFSKLSSEFKEFGAASPLIGMQALSECAEDLIPVMMLDTETAMQFITSPEGAKDFQEVLDQSFSALGEIRALFKEKTGLFPNVGVHCARVMCRVMAIPRGGDPKEFLAGEIERMKKNRDASSKESGTDAMLIRLCLRDGRELMGVLPIVQVDGKPILRYTEMIDTGDVAGSQMKEMLASTTGVTIH